MNRLIGILLMVAVLYGVLLASDENARSLTNQETIASRLGFYGVLTVGVGVLIIAGGIDLSIGSVVGLGAICFGLMLEGPVNHETGFLVGALAGVGLAGAVGMALYDRLIERQYRPWVAGLVAVSVAVGLQAIVWRLAYILLFGRHLPPWAAGLVVLWVAGQIGVVHGQLVTRLRLQAFLVTLCGLFIYRGLARWASTSAVGLGTGTSPEYRESVAEFRRWLVEAPLGVPQQLVLLVIVAALLALFLHGTRHGRYLFALGANEEAARYAGIPTDRYKVLAYIICSTMAGLGGILLILESRSVNATNAGSLLELYAITGAVLGGCSLRGGEGSVPGMFLGAAVLPLLRQLCSFGGISNELEYAVIGFALLLGTVADELLKRRARRRPG